MVTWVAIYVHRSALPVLAPVTLTADAPNDDAVNLAKRGAAPRLGVLLDWRYLRLGLWRYLRLWLGAHPQVR